jgi:hypothetical protein
VIIVNLWTSSEKPTEFMVRDTIPVLRWFVISSMTSLTFCQHRSGCVWLPFTSRDTLVIVSRYLLKSSNLICYFTPYHCCNEARLWSSENQQEHWRHIAKCFLIYYPDTIERVTSWFLPRLLIQMDSYRWTVQVYYVLLFPGMDIPLILVYGHIFPFHWSVESDKFIFLSIVLFNLSWDL